LASADAMISANVPTLIDDYAGLQERGQTLTDAGRKALFTSSLQSKMDRLKQYAQPPAAPNTPAVTVTPEVVQNLSDEQLMIEIQKRKAR